MPYRDGVQFEDLHQGRYCRVVQFLDDDRVLVEFFDNGYKTIAHKSTVTQRQLCFAFILEERIEKRCQEQKSISMEK